MKNPADTQWSRAVVHLILIVGCIRLATAQVAPNTEAQAQADAYWNSKITRCTPTDAYTAWTKGVYFQYRNVSWTIRANQLTQADTMNGVQWQGMTTLRANQTREYTQGAWQPWFQGISDHLDV